LEQLETWCQPISEESSQKLFALACRPREDDLGKETDEAGLIVSDLVLPFPNFILKFLSNDIA
jgi:hypothetical protein